MTSWEERVEEHRRGEHMDVDVLCPLDGEPLRSPTAPTIALLEEHAPYMSPEDEDAIQEAMSDWERDLADLAIRTCQCGEKLDGFDAYWSHLKEVLE